MRWPISMVCRATKVKLYPMFTARQATAISYRVATLPTFLLEAFYNKPEIINQKSETIN